MSRRLIQSAVIFFCAAAFAFAAERGEVLQEITVRAGDTVWSIASYYLKDPSRWPDILKYNNLPVSDPSVALPGMKIKVPILLIKEYLRQAELVKLLNDVRYRKRNESEWGKAQLHMKLNNEDGLRTMDASRADVRFESGDTLRMAENSLVILRPDAKVEEVTVMNGTIRTSRTRAITPTAKITPQDTGTVYRAHVRGDRSTVVMVEQGSAEVLGIETGKSVVVSAGFANITVPKQSPSVPVKVPKLPDFQVPDFTPSGAVILPRETVIPIGEEGVAGVELPEKALARMEIPERPSSAGTKAPMTPESVPKISSDIKGIDFGEPSGTAASKKGGRKSNWAGYKLVVGRDARFAEIVWQEKREIGSNKPAPTAKEYKLPDGKYYQGVCYFDEAGKQSEVRMIGPFEIDTAPPVISITSPLDGAKTRDVLVTIKGVTEPRCSVSINNYQVPVNEDGSFSWAVVLTNEGSNQIHAVSMDQAGNRTNLEWTINLVGALR